MNRYRKFKISFDVIILIFATGLIIAATIGFNEMDRALLYLILGIIFALQRIVGLYKNLNNRRTNEAN